MQHPNAFPEALSLFAIILFLKLVVMGLWNPFMGDGQGRIWLYLAPYIMHGDANRVLVTPHRTQDTVPYSIVDWHRTFEIALVPKHGSPQPRPTQTF